MDEAHEEILPDFVRKLGEFSPPSMLKIEN